jgi:hypothetical protein
VATLNAQLTELEQLHDDLLQDWESLEDELMLTKQEVENMQSVRCSLGSTSTSGQCVLHSTACRFGFPPGGPEAIHPAALLVVTTTVPRCAARN